MEAAGVDVICTVCELGTDPPVVCENEIDYAYQMYGGGMDYNYFVEGLYGMYANPPQQGGYSNGGVTPLAQCAPDGSTQCNSSGWLYTCTNGKWMTGSTQCGG